MRAHEDHTVAYRGVDAVFSVLNQHWDFASAGRLEDFGKLGDGLLQNLWRTYVDFRDDYHDWDVEGHCNT